MGTSLLYTGNTVCLRPIKLNRNQELIQLIQRSDIVAYILTKHRWSDVVRFLKPFNNPVWLLRSTITHKQICQTI